MDSDEPRSFVFNNKLTYFFSSNSNQPSTSSTSLTRCASISPPFYELYNNYRSLEQEVDDALYALNKMDNPSDVFWDLGLHYCKLLKQFYEGYGHKGKQFDTSMLIEQLTERRRSGEAQKNNKAFLVECFQNIKTEFKNVVRHPSVLSQRVAVANFARIYWVFVRLLFESGFDYLQKANILSVLEKIFKQHINVDKLIRYFETPTMTMNFLSVGMFGTRVLINLGIIARHVLFPTEEEKQLSAWTRLTMEWNKRKADILNHSAWMLVNLVTNFRKLFHLSEAWAGGLTVLFIFVDVITLLYIKNQAHKEYIDKKDEYNAERRAIFAHLKQYPKKVDASLKQLEFIQYQLDSLEMRWKAKKATLDYFLWGTAALMSGFFIMLVANPALVIMGGFVIGILSAAMFLSEKEFTDWQLKRLKLETAIANGEKAPLLEKEATAARNDLIKQMLQYIFVPSLLLASSLIYWPAGLALSVLFVVFKITSAYLKHNEQQQPEMNKINSKAEEEDLSPSVENKEQTGQSSCTSCFF